MREIVLDTETTGLSVRSGDRVIEVGCVELINHIATDQSLQFYCNVNKPIDPGATKVHGITNDFLRDKPAFEVNAELFLDFIKTDTLIIHNAEFDVGFINNELKLLEMGPLKNRVIDTVVLARKTLNTRIANLDYLCRRFSIDLVERDLHGALLDSRLLAEVYLELIGGKQISMNLKASENINKDMTTNISPPSPPDLSKVKLSKQEASEHKLLLKKIKNSLWEKINY
jgi:DNA polymerase-3 subunit epsilon